ncbi:MAG: MlaD family protein [Thermodesulfobacteriota bacterium]
MDEKIPVEEDPSEVPDALVFDRNRSISIVWIIPIIALVVGGWLIYKAISEKGPQITITFKTAEGLEAGKTKIRYKEVEIGLVKEIRVSKDLAQVIVKAELVKEATRCLTENTRFWVVRARITASAVSGLGTVFSGAYIDCDPGNPGKPTTEFTGLEEPPIIVSGMEGSHFTLEGERKGSLEIGAPVYYRQIKVGELVSFHLNKDGGKILFTIFIHKPYDRYIGKPTRFWNASGINFKIDAQGLRIDTESIVSMLVGGIAFDNFESQLPSTEPDGKADLYPLFANREAAKEKIYQVKSYWSLHFNQPVRGLSPGSPVELKGMKIGEVIDVKLEFDPEKKEFDIPVLVELEPERVSFRGEIPSEKIREKIMDFLVEKGLRGQLRTASLITGQQYIALDFFPNAKPESIDRKRKFPAIPTVPAQFEEIGSKVTQFIDKLDRIPFEDIGKEIRETLSDVRGLTNTPVLFETLNSLKQVLTELQLLISGMRTELSPELKGTLNQAQKSLRAAEEILQADSAVQQRVRTTLTEIANAARSLRILADYLEQHPEDILRGKGGN